MASKFWITGNEHQMHPKVHSSEYLQFDGGRTGHLDRDMPVSPRTEQLISNFFLRRRIRHLIVTMKRFSSFII